MRDEMKLRLAPVSYSARASTAPDDQLCPGLRKPQLVRYGGLNVSMQSGCPHIHIMVAKTGGENLRK